MQAVVKAATLLHGRCIAATAGSFWDVVTFVPSTRREIPPMLEATAGLARSVAFNSGPQNRLALTRGPRASDPAREVLHDRFAMPGGQQARVKGRHVLLVEDTWTSGAKAQSAAVALRDAGAAYVTVLCVMRWCRWDWPGHAELLRTLDKPYDPLWCPVFGKAGCPPRLP